MNGKQQIIGTKEDIKCYQRNVKFCCQTKLKSNSQMVPRVLNVLKFFNQLSKWFTST